MIPKNPLFIFLVLNAVFITAVHHVRLSKTTFPQKLLRNPSDPITLYIVDSNLLTLIIRKIRDGGTIKSIVYICIFCVYREE